MGSADEWLLEDNEAETTQYQKWKAEDFDNLFSKDMTKSILCGNTFLRMGKNKRCVRSCL